MLVEKIEVLTGVRGSFRKIVQGGGGGGGRESGMLMTLGGGGEERVTYNYVWLEK